MKRLALALGILSAVVLSFPQNLQAQEYRHDEKMIKTYIEFLDDMVNRSRSTHYAFDRSSDIETLEGREYKNNFYLFSWQNIDQEDTTRMMTLNFYFYNDTKKFAFLMLWGKDKNSAGKWISDGKKMAFNVDKGRLYVTILKDDKEVDMFYGTWPYKENLADHYEFYFEQE